VTVPSPPDSVWRNLTEEIQYDFTQISLLSEDEQLGPRHQPARPALTITKPLRCCGPPPLTAEQLAFRERHGHPAFPACLRPTKEDRPQLAKEASRCTSAHFLRYAIVVRAIVPPEMRVKWPRRAD